MAINIAQFGMDSSALTEMTYQTMAIVAAAIRSEGNDDLHHVKMDVETLEFMQSRLEMQMEAVKASLQAAIDEAKRATENA